MSRKPFSPRILLRLGTAPRERADGTPSAMVTPVVVPNPAPYVHDPVCDDRTRAWIEERLRPADALVAVGAGQDHAFLDRLSGRPQVDDFEGPHADLLE